MQASRSPNKSSFPSTARSLALLSALAVCLFGADALAFPEMVRKGYTQCATCHVSPSGGGILTEYGRALSTEALARGQFFFERVRDEKESKTASEDAEREGQFLYGSVKLPQWLLLGGDIRLLQYVVDSPFALAGRFIPMQIDLEAALKIGRFTAVATGGRRESGVAPTSISQLFVSRRHWVGLALGPSERAEMVQLRAGRFFPAFGILDPDHTLLTRRGIGFDQERETYNVEATLLGETGQVTLTGVVGRFSATGFDTTPQALVAQGVLALGTSYRLGLDAYLAQARQMGGLHGILGFSPSWHLWTQVDLIRGSLGALGYVEAAQVGWEFTQGAMLYARQEYLRDPDQAAGVFSDAYTLGFKYYPRTHWEFLLAAQKVRDRVVPSALDTVLTAQLHYWF